MVLYAWMHSSVHGDNANEIRTLRKDETVPLEFAKLPDVVGITLNGGDDLSFLHAGQGSGDISWTLTLMEL